MNQEDVTRFYRDNCKIDPACVNAYVDLYVDDTGQLVLDSSWGTNTLELGVTNMMQRLSDVDQSVAVSEGDGYIMGNAGKFEPYPVLYALEGTEEYSAISVSVGFVPLSILAEEWTNISFNVQNTIIGNDLNLPVPGNITLGDNIKYLELSGSIAVETSEDATMTYEWYANETGTVMSQSLDLVAGTNYTFTLPTVVYNGFYANDTSIGLRVYTTAGELTINQLSAYIRQTGPMGRVTNFTTVLGNIETLLAAL